MSITHASHAHQKPIRVLLLGPMPIAGDHVGGAKAAFVQMVEDMKSNQHIEIDLVNLSRPLRSAGQLKRFVLNMIGLSSAIRAIVTRGHRNQVWALNVSPAGSFTLLPVIVLLASIYRKPVITRMFGGDFWDHYTGIGRLLRSIYNTAFRSCYIVTMETRKLTADTVIFNNIEWFPNTRNNPLTPVPRTHCKKMIFLSHIRREKGVAEIIEAMKLVTADVEIDFFGSPYDHELIAEIESSPRMSYRGELEPDQVYATLSQYDALLLPTFWKGEGLPGVIVEGFQSGLPVIASEWKQISELVTDGHNGLLVEPESSDSLAKSINVMTGSQDMFKRMSINAAATGNHFRSQKWNDLFCQWCVNAHEQNTVHK